MKEETNCPNCGAPIVGAQCPYCGTMFYDFADVEEGKLGYLRIKIKDNILIVKAILSTMDITQWYNSNVDMQLGFHIFKIVEHENKRGN